jgi:hypothetical protein
MLDLVAYTILGFAPVLLALKSAYHFVACKILFSRRLYGQLGKITPRVLNKI